MVAKSLVRLLRSHNEVQAIVLNSIAAMTIKSKGGSKMFQPHIKQFYVRGSDPSHVKILKLEILTNLANSSNISSLLREFQSYINGSDAASVAATIQAIGRCAATITEVTETCLSGLVHLMSNKDPNVVAESVIEIKKLLQTEESEHVDIIVAMSKGLFTNYVISKLTYMVLQIMTQHDAIYLVVSLIMMNDGPSLLSLELALK